MSPRRKTAAKKKAAKQRANRAARAAYLAGETPPPTPRKPAEKPRPTPRPKPTPKYWHGGRPGLQPGTLLVGRSEAERTAADTSFYSGTDTLGEPVPDPDRVYLSSDREFARAFAALMQLRDTTTGVAQHGTVYAVEPIGDVQVDPDFASSGVSWSAPKARVTAVVEEQVDLDVHEVAERLGPHLEWLDGSPVYTKDGDYLPSPEQIEAGPPETIDFLRSILLPWTPLKAINAWIAGQPSGERPDPDNHPGVLHGGADPIPVLAKYTLRTMALLDEGVTFQTSALSHLDAVNAVLGDLATVTADDVRLVLIATHPHEGVIAAAVVTALPYNNRALAFLDAIAVTPTWRHRGVGTVLLHSVNSMLPHRLWFMGGRCGPESTGFFAKTGFTVLKPGVDLPVPTRPDPRLLRTDGASDRSWFYRQGLV